jgi:hypothetical protein
MDADWASPTGAFELARTIKARVSAGDLEAQPRLTAEQVRAKQVESLTPEEEHRRLAEGSAAQPASILSLSDTTWNVRFIVLCSGRHPTTDVHT